jgi:hypothetical protein
MRSQDGITAVQNYLKTLGTAPDRIHEFLDDNVVYETQCGVVFKEGDFTGIDKGKEAVLKLLTVTVPSIYNIQDVKLDEIHASENGRFITTFQTMHATVKTQSDQAIIGKFIQTYDLNEQGKIVRVRDFLVEHLPESS